MIKTFLTTLSLLLSTLPMADSLALMVCKDSRIASNSYRLQTVVLDAGHGGKDDGCSGKHSKEKHLALNITLALGQAIEAAFPDVRVFISVHCNAMGEKLAYIRGTETFVMGVQSSDNHTANRENQSVYLEEDYIQRYQGFDPNSNEGHIFSSIFQNAYLDRSILLAEKIEKYVVRHSKRKSRGVRQDDFVVLRETEMPSVLIETGFLTNSKDEVYLNSKSGQQDMADAIFLAFKEYKEEVEQEATTLITTPNVEKEIIYREPPIVTAPIIEEIVTEAATQPIEKETTESPAPHRATEPIAIEESTVEVEKVAPPIEMPVKEEIVAIIAPPVETPIKEEITVTSAVQFQIQLAASKSPIDTDTPKWQQLKALDVRQERHIYKYLEGNFTNYENAAQHRILLTKQGFNGAFVVAYKDGKRISLEEAKEMSRSIIGKAKP